MEIWTTNPPVTHIPVGHSPSGKYGDGGQNGTLLCREMPYHGRGRVTGTAGGAPGDKYDEEGYITQRVCHWGLEPPLERPVLVSKHIYLSIYTHKPDSLASTYMRLACSYMYICMCMCIYVYAGERTDSVDQSGDE